MINIYINTYLELIQSDLLIKEQQSIGDLKNAGDEEIVIPKEKNCNNTLLIFYILNIFIF